MNKTSVIIKIFSTSNLQYPKLTHLFIVFIPSAFLTLWLSISLLLSLPPSSPLILPAPLNLSRSPGGQWWGCIQRLLLLCSLHPQHKSAGDAHWDHRCLQHTHAHPQAVKAPLQHFHSKYATADAKQHPLTLLGGMLPSTLCPPEGDRELEMHQSHLSCLRYRQRKRLVHTAQWAKEKKTK